MEAADDFALTWQIHDPDYPEHMLCNANPVVKNIEKPQFLPLVGKRETYPFPRKKSN